MGTVFATILSLIASTILSAIFNFFGGMLSLGIIQTTGIIWLPLVIIVAMSGAAVFAGMVIALRLIKSANPGATFFGVVVLLCLLTGMSIMGHLIKKDPHMIKEILLSVASLVSMLVGAKVGSVNARDE